MRFLTAALVVLLCGASAGLASSQSPSNNSTQRACPPPGFDSAANFDLAKYISAPWFVQQQMRRRV